MRIDTWPTLRGTRRGQSDLDEAASQFEKPTQKENM